MTSSEELLTLKYATALYWGGFMQRRFLPVQLFRFRPCRYFHTTYHTVLVQSLPPHVQRPCLVQHICSVCTTASMTAAVIKERMKELGKRFLSGLSVHGFLRHKFLCLFRYKKRVPMDVRLR